MKSLVADKLMASLLGVEREDDATTLFSSVLGNLDGEGMIMRGLSLVCQVATVTTAEIRV